MLHHSILFYTYAIEEYSLVPVYINHERLKVFTVEMKRGETTNYVQYRLSITKR